MKRHSVPTSVAFTALAAAVLAVPSPLFAQTAQLEAVTVLGRALPPARVAGWGDVPIAELPVSASVIGTEQLRGSGAQRLADLLRFDAGFGDAYNSEGYWDIVSARGYVLDNRFNYRRDGLPINAETAIALDNKARVELLKGTSGMQAGTSAPGGLVNYVVKRPLADPLRSASLEWRERGSVTGAVDLSQRAGPDGAVGLRLNAALAELKPQTRSADGRRHLLALAGDARLGADTLIEAEVETSRRSQPSVPGFSLLGNTVPAPGDPRINLNHQPWSLPVVLEGHTASLRATHRLDADWRAVAHAATQRLRSDDRVAFPFGCFAPDPAPDGTYYADRFCPDGSFDLYDFRSENERRRSDALDLSLAGRVQTGAVTHRVDLGVLRQRVKNRFQRQAFNFAGTGNVDGRAVTPGAPDLTGENTNRDERSTELYARDAIALGPAWTAWLGLRHVRLHRESVRTDGSEAVAYDQRFNTPFFALSHALATGQIAYASWGRGVESEVVPNLPRYGSSAGTPLPALRSRQAEAGIKGGAGAFDWDVAAFDIARPVAVDQGVCDVAASCSRVIDGRQRHRGLEGSLGWSSGDWSLRGGALRLRARRERSQDVSSDGLLPPNVAERTLRLHAEHRPVPGWAWSAALIQEGSRYVLPDNSASIPGWTRIDVGARFEQALGSARATWRAGIDNLADRRAWKESPYQFGHAWLFPLAPRELRLSVQVDL